MRESERPRRVAVTGMGVVTALGNDLDTLWQAVVEGRSGVAPIRRFDCRGLPVRIGSEAEAPAIDGEPEGTSRAGRFGLCALDQAWSQAGLDGRPFDRRRAGVAIGASTGPVGLEPEAQVEMALRQQDAGRMVELFRQWPALPRKIGHGSIANAMAARKGLGGACLTVQTACASATQAIGEAFLLIRSGRADLMVTGGADSLLSLLGIAGFALLGALSTREDRPELASRPFDARRDGFVLGEGSGILVLEELEHARERGASVLVEVVGYGASTDAYRFTDVPPDGRGAAACLTAAMASAEVRPEEIGYINAHGTGTVQNDRAETLAIKRAFGAAARRVAISSNKSQLGHLACAAGGVELILTVQALRASLLPPTLNLDHPDPECDLDYVPHECRRAAVEVALSSSFGFGGQNGAVVVRRAAPAGGG